MFVIAIEGISGAGKSTFVAAFMAALDNSGNDILHFRGMQEADLKNPVQDFLVDKFLRSDRFIRAPFWVETSLLVATAKYNDEISLCQRKPVVIRENYIHGFLAYQTARAVEDGIELSTDLSLRLAAIASASGLRWPDLVIWIDVDVDQAVDRLLGRLRDQVLPIKEKEVSLLRKVNDQYRLILGDQRDVTRVENSGSVETLNASANQLADEIAVILRSGAESPNRVYIAGPLFTQGERFYLEQLDQLLVAEGFRTYLPHRDGGLATTEHAGKSKSFFDSDFKAICWADAAVAVLNGAEVDSGTAWEVGAAFAMGKPVVGLYDDTRGHAQNLMLSNSVKITHSLDQSIEALTALFS